MHLFLARILQNVSLVADKNLDRRLTSPFALGDPLLDSLKRWSLGNVEQVNDGSGAINILMDVLVMSLLSRHVEINYLVLVGVVNVEGGLKEALQYQIRAYLDVQFAGLLILNDRAEGLRDGVQEGALANS